MTAWTGRAILYLALALAGLIGTWTFNILAVVQRHDYLGDWLNSGPAVASLVVDVLVAAIATAVFMVLEGRRLGMRAVWVYVLLIPFVALAFALPLFLAMRERRVRTLRGGA